MLVTKQSDSDALQHRWIQVAFAVHVITFLSHTLSDLFSLCRSLTWVVVMRSAVKPRNEGTPDGANAAASPDEHQESGEAR